MSGCRKCAWIRGDGLEGKNCPFGLPITLGCKNAGDSVLRMCPLDAVSEEDKERVEKANKRIYIHEKTGKQCPYAHEIIESKDSVDCDFGDNGAGLGSVPVAGSPVYPQVFVGVGLDGLSAFPLGYHADWAGSRNMPYGLISLVSKDEGDGLEKTGEES